jgi:hypothetical protein
VRGEVGGEVIVLAVDDVVLEVGGVGFEVVAYVGADLSMPRWVPVILIRERAGREACLPGPVFCAEGTPTHRNKQLPMASRLDEQRTDTDSLDAPSPSVLEA